MSFQLSPDINRNKTFLVNRSELKGRLDPNYYLPKYLNAEHTVNKLKNENLTSFCLKIKKGIFYILANEYVDNGIPFLRISNLKNETITANKLTFITPKKHNENSNTAFNAGDLLLSKTGTLAISTIPKEFPVCNISQDLIGIKLKEGVNSDFLSIFLNSNLGIIQLERIMQGQVQQHLTLTEVQKVKIPLMEMARQKQIVSKRNAAYASKKQKEAEAQRLLDSIDDYLLGELGIVLPEQAENTVQSRIFYRQASEVAGGRYDSNFYKHFYTDVTDSIKAIPHDKLGHFVRFPNESWNQKDLFTSTFPYIEIGEIELSFGEIRNINHVSMNEVPSRAKMIIRSGDILVSTTRPSRGAIIKIEETNEIYIASTGFSVIREITNPDVDSIYLYYALRQSISLRQMEQRSSGGNYPAITQEELANIIIPLPSLEQQRAIAAHTTNIRNQAKQLQQQAQAELEQAKQQVEAMILGGDKNKE